jgi:hypothetical protein
MALIRDAAFEAHIAAVVAAAPDPPRDAIDGIRRVIGRDLHRYREQARAEAAKAGSDAA